MQKTNKHIGSTQVYHRSTHVHSFNTAGTHTVMHKYKERAVVNILVAVFGHP